MAREQLRFDSKKGIIKLPLVVQKVCTHGSGPELELRLRGDMGFEVDTFAGMREDTYVCMQCGNSKPAAELYAKLQAYVLGGKEFTVSRKRAES